MTILLSIIDKLMARGKRLAIGNWQLAIGDDKRPAGDGDGSTANSQQGTANSQVNGGRRTATDHETLGNPTSLV